MRTAFAPLYAIISTHADPEKQGVITGRKQRGGNGNIPETLFRETAH